MKTGALVPALLMLPSLVWIALPGRGAAGARPAPIALRVAENAARVAVVVLPLFGDLDLGKPASAPVVSAMCLVLGVYYAAWMRYFLGGKALALLSTPMLGLPVPMAVTPALFLILASYLLGSWTMFAAAVCFGVAHVWSSVLTLGC